MSFSEAETAIASNFLCMTKLALLLLYDRGHSIQHPFVCFLTRIATTSVLSCTFRWWRPFTLGFFLAITKMLYSVFQNNLNDLDRFLVSFRVNWRDLRRPFRGWLDIWRDTVSCVRWYPGKLRSRLLLSNGGATVDLNDVFILSIFVVYTAILNCFLPRNIGITNGDHSNSLPEADGFRLGLIDDDRGCICL